MAQPSGAPDFMAQGTEGASPPPEQSANPFGAAPDNDELPEAAQPTAAAAAPLDSSGAPDEQTNGAIAYEAMDPDLFTTPAADSYAPAGTGTHGELVHGGEDHMMSNLHMLVYFLQRTWSHSCYLLDIDLYDFVRVFIACIPLSTPRQQLYP
jgi:hypothetical protein